MTGLLDLPGELQDRYTYLSSKGEPDAKRARMEPENTRVRIVTIVDHAPGKMNIRLLQAHIHVIKTTGKPEDEIAIPERSNDYTHNEIGEWAIEQLGGQPAFIAKCLAYEPKCEKITVHAVTCRPPLSVLVQLHADAGHDKTALNAHLCNVVTDVVVKRSTPTTVAEFLRAKGDLPVNPSSEIITLHRGARQELPVGPFDKALFFTDNFEVAGRYNGRYGEPGFLMTAEVRADTLVLDISNVQHVLLDALGGYNTGDAIRKLKITGVIPRLVGLGYIGVALNIQSMAEIILFKGSIATCAGCN